MRLGELCTTSVGPISQRFQSVTWDGARQRVSSPVRTALEKVLSALDGSVLTREECLALASCSGDDLFGLVVAANQLRWQLVGDVVSYVVTRNINFTNVCFVGCARNSGLYG